MAPRRRHDPPRPRRRHLRAELILALADRAALWRHLAAATFVSDNARGVEQTPAEQDGFPRSMIDAPDNLVRVPRWKHHEITAWYNSANERFDGLSPRRYLRSKSWDEWHGVGLEALAEYGVMKP